MSSTQNAKEAVLTITEASRIIPDRGDHTDIKKIRGVISSMRPVFRMIAGEYGECPFCHTLYNKTYDKPLFYAPELPFIPYCKNENAFEHPVEFKPMTKEKGRFKDDEGNYFDIVKDADGKIVKQKIYLKVEYEFRNALIIELQDEDTYEDLERLEVILFDQNTVGVQAGELVTITGQIYIEYLTTSREAKLRSRLYSHTINYETRKEISISNVDKDAIHRFALSKSNTFGKTIIDKLVKMFAPHVIGYEFAKEALLFSAASCGNDFQNNLSDVNKQRVRINTFLVGDPGTAKSMLVREVTKIVPNSKYESAQNSTGKSLTAIVSKEVGDASVLRLGPVPLAKEAICGLNELGRMSFDDQAPLLDVMEEGAFSINKYGMNARIRSPTVIIASANPTTQKWTNTNDDGKISLDDIPAVKPMIDRFDYVLIFITIRDPTEIREYAYKKSKLESSIIPNYNEFLIKYLKYAKRFEPKISDEAEVILNEYYISIAKMAGSARIRDTVYRTAKMISRLNLREIVSREDAIEACKFYNVILGGYDQIRIIPANPRDHAYNEFLYLLEAEQKPIPFEDLIKKACDKDEYIKTYIGDDRKVRHNKKLRAILEMMLQNSHVVRIQMKPTVLQWISSKPEAEPKKESSTNNDNKCDQCDQCACDFHGSTAENLNNSMSGQTVAFSEVVNSEINQQKSQSHESHRSHSQEEDSDYYKFMDDKCTEWEMGFEEKFMIKRAYANNWICRHSSTCEKLRSDKPGIWFHAFNHVIAEIKGKLGVLKGFDADTQKEELRQMTKDQLELLASKVEHNTPLEKAILAARDYLIDGGRS
ncbi:MAG: AAA family ATPase [Nitrososphaeraceae archaeon]